MDRRPPVKMESREPKSIRFTPSEWAALCEAARIRGFEPAVFVRMLTLYALSIASAPAFPEAALGMPAQMLTGSRGIRRF
jgi:hypothetical protein